MLNINGMRTYVNPGNEAGLKDTLITTQQMWVVNRVVEKKNKDEGTHAGDKLRHRRSKA